MVGQAPNVTIADFYKMVEALTDVMQEVQDEKDAPDSIEEFLSFLNTLTSDIEVSLIQLCMHCRVGFRFEFKVQGHPN